MPGYTVLVTPERAVEGPLWRQLAAGLAPASIRELHLATRAHPNAIQHRLDRWVRAGLVTRIDGRPKRYAMNDDTPRDAAPPPVARDGRIAARTPTARASLWRAMRVLKSFDLPALQMTAQVSRRSAEDTVNHLQRAGYLRQVVRGNGMTGTWSTYRLVRDTGPRPPVVARRMVEGRRLTEVVDGNTGRRTDVSPATVSLRRKPSAALVDGGEG